MRFEIPLFIPPEVCLDCRGCCRYAQAKTAWAPFFLAEEIEGLRTRGILSPRFFGKKEVERGRGARIRLEKNLKGDAAYVCPCLDATGQKCRIYLDRPLDCRLYPFLLQKTKEGVWLAADARCPYVGKTRTTSAFQKYAERLTAMLSSQDFLHLAEDNPGIVETYEGDLLLISPLPFLVPIETSCFKR